MSPEFESWRAFLSTDKVDSKVKGIVKTAVRLGDKDFATRMHNGFLALIVDGELKKIIDPREASEGVKQNASKSRGDWIHVHGLNNRQSARGARKSQKRYEEYTLENPPRARSVGWKNRSKHRGKHRSDNKGPGMKALLRNMHGIGKRRKS